MPLAVGTFSSPAPQWNDFGAIVASKVKRLIPYLDASGYWVLLDSNTLPSGAYKTDVGSGFGIIDDTTTVGLKPTLIPAGFVVTY